MSSLSSMRLQRSVTRLAVRIGCRALGVGNASDHVHVIAVHPPTLSVSELARRLKGATSRVLAFRLPEGFAWQQGYFAESLGDPSAAIAYVRDQRRHHEQPNFLEPWEDALS